MSKQQQKEDSVMFSLRSLMSIEDDRVRQEEEGRRQAEEAAVSRVEEERRREVAERQQRAQSEEAARVADERARREAEAQAAREREEAALRIRLEAESKLRERELSLRMEQEQKLALIASQRRTGMHPGAVAVGVLALVGALGAGAFFGVVKPQQEASAEETRRAESARRDSDERRMVTTGRAKMPTRVLALSVVSSKGAAKTRCGESVSQKPSPRSIGVLRFDQSSWARGLRSPLALTVASMRCVAAATCWAT